MEYRLKVEEETLSLSLDENEGNLSARFSGDDDPMTAEDVTLRHGELSFLLNGKRERAFVSRGDGGLWVWWRGGARFVRDADEAERRTGRKRGGGEGGIITPMTPGVVARVLVDAGQTVEKGQGLVVISAMKMESTLSAPYAGTVTAVPFEEGASVKPGDVLVEIEAAEEKTDE